LIGELLLRSLFWFVYLRHAGNNFGLMYMKLIYAPTFSRLDSLVWGVLLAILKNYHATIWSSLTKHGNFFLLLGIMSYIFVAYIFQTSKPGEYISVALNYSFLGLSSAALTLSALCDNSLLNKYRIPGAMLLATWSYAIYLTHKSLIHITQILLTKWHLSHSITLMLVCSILLSLGGGWLLYKIVERPFLELRERIGKANSDYYTIHSSSSTPPDRS
jgi:peptidoglycan/LPS O-acetylase OafA/YrhL